MCKQANKLGRSSFKLRANQAHSVHTEHKEASREYVNALKRTKQIHWCDWLEKAEDPDIWTVHRLISSPASNGGSSRIPGLKYKDPADNEEKTAANNEEKSRALAAMFFPEKPPENMSAEPSSYPQQCKKPMKIMKEQ